MLFAGLLLWLCVSVHLLAKGEQLAAETVHADVTGWSSAPCFLFTYLKEGGAPPGCAGCGYKHLHQILPGNRQRPPPKAS